MSEQSIFGADQAPQTQAAPAQETPKPFVIPTEAESLIGDGKKYNSVDAALKALPHAQTHIRTLEDENKALKEELVKRKTAEEYLNEFKATQTQQQVSEQPSGFNVDPSALENIVSSVLEKKSQQTQAISNASVITSRFTEMYGDRAEEMYNKLAAANGLSVQQMNQMAMSAPTVVLNLAGFRTNNTTVGRTTSDVNIPTQQQNNQYDTKVRIGATTKETMNAFAAARAKVEAQLQKGNK